MSVVYFLDVEKYPPSLQFLLMTIGPSLMLLSLLDRVSEYSAIGKMLSPLLIFGRVPLFFNILHIFMIHLLAVAAAFVFHQPTGWLLHGGFFVGQVAKHSGYGLPMVYAMWLLAIVILYLPCRWFADLKANSERGGSAPVSAGCIYSGRSSAKVRSLTTNGGPNLLQCFACPTPLLLLVVLLNPV